MKKIKAITTFSVILDSVNAKLILKWNGKADTLVEALNMMEHVLVLPVDVLEQVRKLKPVEVASNKMMTESFALLS